MIGWWPLLLSASPVQSLKLLLADRVYLLKTAGITVFGPAVVGLFSLTGTLVFSFEEGGGYSHVNVSPGEHLIERPLPLRIEVRFDACLLESLLPVFVIKAFPPGIKGAAQFPGVIDDLTQPTVTP